MRAPKRRGEATVVAGFLHAAKQLAYRPNPSPARDLAGAKALELIAIATDENREGRAAQRAADSQGVV